MHSELGKLAKLYFPAQALRTSRVHLSDKGSHRTTLAANKPAGRLVISGRPSKATGPLLAPNCSTEKRKGPQLYFQPRSRRAWYEQRLCL